jgi:UDP-3-O-[3-hydroxymyristoyl] N-acetylglucosamine deacetylase
MAQEVFGKILSGELAVGELAYARFDSQSVDRDFMDEPYEPYPAMQRTVAGEAVISGPGTFLGKEKRTITIQPHSTEGWWFNRMDLPECLATRVSVRNVWTTGDIVSNIVLRSGSPHNYVRMVEHIVSLKLGLGIDNVMISIDAGDPPLFVRGSLDLLETMKRAEIVATDRPARFFTVKERVSCITPGGGFLIIEPCGGEVPRLNIDCAVDFPNIMGRQRIRFPMTVDHFTYGAEARTNTTSAAKWYCQTIGKLFADVRHLGYNHENVLVAGRKRYLNEPRMVTEGGKSLEAVWHRAALDLLAALALVEEGRFVGNVTSYKVGHALDVHMITQLYMHDLLTEWNG